MTSLGHVNIDTARIEETIAFYCGLLGFVTGKAATRPEEPEFIWLFDQDGFPCVHLHEVSEQPSNQAGSGLNHIAFNHDDPIEAEAFLRRKKIEFRRSDTVIGGVFQFNLTDPNGIQVELTFGHRHLRRS